MTRHHLHLNISDTNTLHRQCSLCVKYRHYPLQYNTRLYFYGLLDWISARMVSISCSIYHKADVSHLSLPARSTITKVLSQKDVSPSDGDWRSDWSVIWSSWSSRIITFIMRAAWLRDEVWLAFVEAVFRFRSPLLNISSKPSRHCTLTVLNPSTNTLPFFSLIAKWFGLNPTPVVRPSPGGLGMGIRFTSLSHPRLPILGSHTSKSLITSQYICKYDTNSCPRPLLMLDRSYSMHLRDKREP